MRRLLKRYAGLRRGHEPLEATRKGAGGLGLRPGDPLAALRGEGFFYRGNQLVVERVAGIPGRDVTHERAAQEPEVAHEVEHLVPDELIRKTQAGFVQHAVLGQDNRIVERAAPNQISAAQGFNFFDDDDQTMFETLCRGEFFI